MLLILSLLAVSAGVLVCALDRIAALANRRMEND
jgi:hypothetical protein